MWSRFRFVVAACLAASVLCATAAAAGPLSLNLASAPGSKVTVTVSPGTVVTFTLFNKLPAGQYTITVEERAIPIPPIPTPAIALGGLATDACAPILKEAEKIGAAADEPAVEKAVKTVRTGLAAGECTAGALAVKINEWVASTTFVVPGEYRVSSGMEIVLTVARDDRVWTMVVSGGARGEWMTSYGVSMAPSEDERFFAKATGENKFVITAEERVKDVRMIPAAYFTWLPRSRATRNLAVGPTAGLGLSDNTAAVFAGISATYNWNLTFIGGVAVSSHTRLRGQYKAGDEVSENLTEEQLHRNVFRPTWTVAVTYRFAGNPFGGDAASGGEKEKPAEKKPEEKKEEKKEEKQEEAKTPVTKKGTPKEP